MTTEAMKVVATVRGIGYTRVSKEDQAREEKASLTQQRAAVTALAERLGVPLGELFTDPGRSGGTAEGRPQFMALVRYCEQHPQPRTRPGFVLVLNDSRWGRFDDPEEATYWRVHLAKQGWRVRFAEGDDTDDPIARGVIRSINSGVSSQYRENIKTNAKRGARGTAEKGFWCNEAPLGYRRITVGGSRPGTVLDIGQRKTDDEHVKLVPSPEYERRAVRYMFDRYDSGEASLGDLVDNLKTQWPGLRKWSRQVVRRILQNPAYCGDLVWMRRSNGPRDGEQVVVRDAHASLVERMVWDRVQARLTLNQKETRSTVGGYPLRGFLTCAACGAPYLGAGGPKGPAHDEDRYRFYREKETNHPCGHRLGTLQKRAVEPLLVTEVAKVVARPEVQRIIARELDRLLGMSPDTHRQLGKQREELEAERKEIVRQIGKKLIQEDEAAERLAEIRAGIDALARQTEQATFETARRGALAAERDRMLNMAKKFAEQARKANGATLRELLRPWLAGAAFDKAQRTITLSIRQVPFMTLATKPGRGSR